MTKFNKLEMSSIQHTSTHPHGKMWTNEDQSIEFLRISKNGSTSFTKNLNLNFPKKFTSSRISALKLACIRNPYERFLSSIPETLKRIATKKVKGDDVVVTQNIFDHILCSTMMGSEEILDVFMSAIASFGFFDAHHEPQVHFFLKNDGTIAFDPHCFDLRYMDDLIQVLGGRGCKKFNSRTYAASPIAQEKWKPRIKTLLGKLGVYRRDVYYQPLDKNSIQYAFLMQFGSSFNIFKNQRRQLDYSLQKLNRDLKRHLDSADFKDFISQQYYKDIEVYEKLSIYQDLQSLQKFSTAYNESGMR